MNQLYKLNCEQSEDTPSPLTLEQMVPQRLLVIIISSLNFLLKLLLVPSFKCVLCPLLYPVSLSHPHPQCDKEIQQVQSQLEDYKDPPLSLSRLSLKQQKFKTFRERANVSPPHLSSNIFISVTFCWGFSFSSVQIFQLMKFLRK